MNRCPTTSIQNTTPHEAWSSCKLNVDYFQIFGCITYAHIPDAARKKLDDKGQKCIFLGSSDKSKAYRLFNPITKKIFVSRDVIFNEEAISNWSDNNSFQHIPVSVEEEEELE